MSKGSEKPLEFEGEDGKAEAEVAKMVEAIILPSKYLCFSNIFSSVSVLSL